MGVWNGWACGSAFLGALDLLIPDPKINSDPGECRPSYGLQGTCAYNFHARTSSKSCFEGRFSGLLFVGCTRRGSYSAKGRVSAF